MSNRCFAEPHQNQKACEQSASGALKGEIILVTFASPKSRLT